jgi:hypothetical protein
VGSSAPPKVTIYWLVKSRHRAKTDPLVNQVENNLRHNRAIKFKNVQEILEPEEDYKKAFKEAEKLVKTGEKARFNLELDKAITQLTQAVETYEKYFHGFLDSPFGTQPLLKALKLLAVTHHQNGQAESAKMTITKMLALRPKLTFDPKVFPAGMKETMLNLRLEMDEIGTTSLQIASRPGAAEVHVNGKKLGRAPATASNVQTGYHYVTLRRKGFRTVTKAVKVEPPKAGSVTIRMEKVSAELFSHLKAARQAMGGPRATPGIRGAGTLLKVDILMLGRVALRGQEATVTIVAYDLRTGRLLKSVRRTVDTGDLGSKPDDIAKEIFSGVRLDGKAGPIKIKKKKKTKPGVPAWVRFKRKWRKFRRWKGFWPVVGGTAGVIVVGVVVGLTLGLMDRGQVRMPGGTRFVVFKHGYGARVASW